MRDGSLRVSSLASQLLSFAIIAYELICFQGVHPKLEVLRYVIIRLVCMIEGGGCGSPMARDIVLSPMSESGWALSNI